MSQPHVQHLLLPVAPLVCVPSGSSTMGWLQQMDTVLGSGALAGTRTGEEECWAKARNPPGYSSPLCVARRTLGCIRVLTYIARRQLAVPSVQRCLSAMLGGTSRD